MTSKPQSPERSPKQIRCTGQMHPDNGPIIVRLHFRDGRIIEVSSDVHTTEITYLDHDRASVFEHVGHIDDDGYATFREVRWPSGP